MKKSFAVVLVLVAFLASACTTYKVCPTYAKKTLQPSAQQ
jgi:hypothetical protein